MANNRQESSGEMLGEMLKALAREARREPTPAEAQLWEMLRDHRCGGLHFRRQKVTNPFRLDFYCCQTQLAIEVDGSIHEEESVHRRDLDRQQALEQELGVRFLRVTNEDVLCHPQQTLARILHAAQEQPAHEITNELSSPLSRLRPLLTGPRQRGEGRGRAKRGGGGPASP